MNTDHAPKTAMGRCGSPASSGGFCRKHQARRVFQNGQWSESNPRPHGELPFDPRSSQFCRALKARRVGS